MNQINVNITAYGSLITDAWQRLILDCRDRFPYGDMTLRIENSEPSEPLKEVVRRRYKASVPRPTFMGEKGEFIPTQPWLVLMLYCSRFCRYAVLEVRIVNAEPIQRLGEERQVRFDNLQTLPELVEELTASLNNG